MWRHFRRALQNCITLNIWHKLKTDAYGKCVTTNCVVSVSTVTFKCYEVYDRLDGWMQQTGQITADTEFVWCKILYWNWCSHFCNLKTKLVISQGQISFFFAFTLLAEEKGIAITAHRGSSWKKLLSGTRIKTPWFFISGVKETW